jgi:hypothetical protein
MNTQQFEQHLKTQTDNLNSNLKNDTYYIRYLSKKHNFRQMDKIFEGVNAMQNAIKWGKANLENFNINMVQYKY